MPPPPAPAASALSPPGPAPPPEAASHTLAKETELRLEVATGAPAFVRLVAGSAEVFGVELAEGRT
jgi:polyribonucleotide 5'-hydroxyl-kinase